MRQFTGLFSPHIHLEYGEARSLPHRMQCAAGSKKSCFNEFLMLARRSWTVRLARRPLGVAGLARQHAEIDAELLQRLRVLAVVVAAEDQLGIGGAVQPAVLLDL